MNTILQKSHFRSILVLCLVLFSIFIYVLAETIIHDTPYRLLNKYRIGYGIYNFLQIPYNFLSNPPYPEDERLRTFNLHIDGLLLDQLDKDLPSVEESNVAIYSWSGYVKGYLEYNGRLRKVKVRYRGRNPYHWRYFKKSIRVKTKKSQLFEKSRKLNFINPREKTMICNPLGYSLGPVVGLLTPKCEHIKLKFNGRLRGVYFNLEFPDESFLRNHNRLPGDVYALTTSDGKKKAYLNSANKEDNSNFIFIRELAKRFDNISFTDTPEVDPLFRKFPREYSVVKTLKEFEKVIDVDKFLIYSALGDITASFHGMQDHNLLLYFDPSKGTFEPLVNDLYAYGTAGYPDLALNYLTNVYIKSALLIPGNYDRKKRKIYDLIYSGPFTREAMLNKVEKFYQLTAPDIRADIYKDYFVNPFDEWSPVSVFYTNIEYENTVSELREKVKKRYNYLRDSFKGHPLTYYVVSDNISSELTGKNKEYPVLKLVFVSNKENSAKLKKISINSDENKNIFRLWRDQNHNGKLDDMDKSVARGNRLPGGELEFIVNEDLFAGRLPKENNKNKLGPTLEPVSLSYPYFITIVSKSEKPVGIASDDLSFTAVNFVTGSPVEVKQTNTIGNYPLDKILHPWEFEETSSDVVISAGQTVIDKDIIIDRGSTLTIEPGARLLFKDSCSIFAFGKVIAKGTSEKPIIFSSQDPLDKWGVLALQGASSKDSVFKYCTFERGSGDSYLLVNYTGMVSVYNSSADFTNCVFRDNLDSDDVFNAKHSRISLVNCNFTNAFADAVDCDYSKGMITGTNFIDSGNDCIDLMTSDAKIYNNFIKASGDSGISVGERSNPVIFNNVLTSCVTAIAIKDGSQPVILNNVFMENKTAISGYLKNWKYGDGGYGKIMNSLFIDNQDNIKEDKNSKIEVKNSYFDYANKYSSLVADGIDVAGLKENGYLVSNNSKLAKAGIIDKELMVGLVFDDKRLNVPVGLVKPIRVVAQ